MRTLGAKAYNGALPTMTSETMKNYRGCKLKFRIALRYLKKMIDDYFLVYKKWHRDFHLSFHTPYQCANSF